MSFTAGGTTRWTSPELLDPDKFGITDYRPTKQSDCYALGMVVYEVRANTIDLTSAIVSSDITRFFMEMPLFGRSRMKRR